MVMQAAAGIVNQQQPSSSYLNHWPTKLNNHHREQQVHCKGSSNTSPCCQVHSKDNLLSWDHSRDHQDPQDQQQTWQPRIHPTSSLRYPQHWSTKVPLIIQLLTGLSSGEEGLSHLPRSYSPLNLTSSSSSYPPSPNKQWSMDGKMS